MTENIWNFQVALFSALTRHDGKIPLILIGVIYMKSPLFNSKRIKENSSEIIAVNILNDITNRDWMAMANFNSS